MTMLSIIQGVAEHVGFAAPSSVVGNQDRTAKQLLRILNLGGGILAQKRWPVLQTEFTFQTTAGTPSYALPEDFAGLLSDTVWDRTNYWQLRGGLTPPEWQIRKSAITVSVSTRKRFRIKPSAPGAKMFFIDPTPDAAQMMVFEYLSANWVISSSGDVFHNRFVSDDDVSMFGNRLHEMDCLWRFRSAKGMEYAEARHDFDLYLEAVFGDEAGAGAINLGGPLSNDQAWRMNVRETGFG